MRDFIFMFNLAGAGRIYPAQIRAGQIQPGRIHADRIYFEEIHVH